MKYLKFLIIFISTISWYSNASEKLIDQIVAVFNNEIILLSELKNQLAISKLNLKKNNIISKNKIIKKLILDKILIKVGNESNIKISDAMIIDEISKIAYKENKTFDQFKNKLISLDIDFYFYKNQIKSSLIMEKIYNNLINQNNLLENIIIKEAKSFHSLLKNKIEKNIEIQFDHIIIPIINNNKKENKQKQIIAKFLLKKIKYGIELDNLKDKYPKELKLVHQKKFLKIKLKNLPSYFYNFLKYSKAGDVIGPIVTKNYINILKVHNILGRENEVFIKRLKLRHIFLKKLSDISDQKYYKKLLDIRQEIQRKKILFDEAAKKISEDNISSKNGGYLGWFSNQNIDVNLFNLLNELNINEISLPVKYFGNWHLFQVLDKKIFNDYELKSQDLAYKIIYNRKINNFINRWIKEINNNTNIKIFDEFNDEK